MTEPDEEADAIEFAVEVLLGSLDRHHEQCQDSKCLWLANVLAYLAHCLGANEHDLRHIPRLVLKHDIQCRHNGVCHTHRMRGEGV